MSDKEQKHQNPRRSPQHHGGHPHQGPDERHHKSSFKDLAVLYIIYFVVLLLVTAMVNLMMRGFFQSTWIWLVPFLGALILVIAHERLGWPKPRL